ncbi:MAG: hypothetical protein R3Y53_01995 [Bacillota bacterium]
MDSILTSIKKMLGITEEYIVFDPDIILHINSAFTILNQLGVGPPAGFFICDNTNTWGEFIQDDRLEFVKTYVFFRVRLAFDPPTSVIAVETIQKLINELEYRILIRADIEKVGEENG